MGLFDTKYCDVCGGKIGMLGNRKLSDGNLCRACASKLSPWFTGRKASTVEDIRAHLAYREANREAAAYFRASRTFGTGEKLYIDEGAGSFAVTRAKDLVEDNADIVGLASLTDCAVDIHETRTELHHKGPDGKTVSYEPRRYEYSYDFDIILSVDHPWFSQMRFRLNPGSVKAGAHRVGSVIRCPEYDLYYDEAMELRETMLGLRDRFRALQEAELFPPEEAPAEPEPETPAEPEPPAEEPPAAAAPGPRFCPWCGAPVSPPGAAFCSSCGKKLSL